ncbi:MAG: CmpA/NrtA family ABC transporter substrate-binding protein, partial [Rhodocyclaceae bacterium]
MNGQAFPAGTAFAAGSDAPEKSEVRVGFVALTDCAPVVMAAAKGFDAKYGIRIVPTRASSWASIRDQLMAGDLDAAQILYGLVYGLELGVGGPQQEMAILMTLNQNGQGISLASQLRDQGVTDGEALAALVAKHPAGSFAFAQTFPTGTHALWLNYWLAAIGIDPLRDVRTISVPPPQMVLTCRLGRMHGFCVGEPWNQRGIADGVSFSVASSQDVWPDHPEKVLGTTAAWVAQYPNTARALT